MGRSLCKYLLVVLCLCGVAEARTPPQLDSLIKYTELAFSYNAPDSIVAMCVNRAIQEVCDQLPALGKLDTIRVKADSTGVAMNSDFNRARYIARMEGTSAWRPLAGRSTDTLWPIYNGKVDSAKMDALNTNEPKYWYIHGTRLFMYPKFNRGTSTDSFVVHYYANDAQLMDTTGSTDSTLIEDKYRPAVVTLAQYYLANYLGRFGEAAEAMRRYNEMLGIREVKGRNDSAN